MVLFARVAVTCFIMLTCFGCKVEDQQWPQSVINSLWVPSEAQIEKKYHEGSYTIEYAARVCYPAKDVIDEMVKAMISKGWKRLGYGPLNPSVPLNHVLNKWNRGLDKNYRVEYGWIEFWEDNEKNIVEYRFVYQPAKGDIIIGEDCSLRGIISYIPRDVVNAMLDKIKEIEKDMRKGKTNG